MLFLAVLLTPGAAWPASTDGAFAHVSDIHFNPFDPPALARDLADRPLADWPSIFASDSGGQLSRWGEDTNHALLDTALAAIARTAADADFVLVTGDLIAHDFPEKVEQALGFSPGSSESRAFAAKTTLFVLDRLQATLPGKPILITLGNTDAGCGDYRIDPGGPFLEATRERVRDLAGPRLLSADFDRSYLAGGYYAAAHPTLAGTTILVLDDAMWAAFYRNSCGNTGSGAAEAMMAWLEKQLAAAEADGRKVWLLHHIPAGIDAYSTLNASGDTCRQRIVPMLAEPFASRFTGLLSRYGATVTASFAGHDHHDDYRLLRDGDGAVVGMEKIAPAISPVFGQNPGFHIFAYSRASGAISGFTTWYLANLGTADGQAAANWQQEYTFEAAYGVERVTPGGIEAMWNGLLRGGPTAETFRRLYNVGHGDLGTAELPAYLCAIGHADPAAFAACYCDR